MRIFFFMITYFFITACSTSVSNLKQSFQKNNNLIESISKEIVNKTLKIDDNKKLLNSDQNSTKKYSTIPSEVPSHVMIGAIAGYFLAEKLGISKTVGKTLGATTSIMAKKLIDLDKNLTEEEIQKLFPNLAQTLNIGKDTGETSNPTQVTGNDKIFKASLKNLSSSSTAYEVKKHNYSFIDSLDKIQDYNGLLTFVIFPRNILEQSKKSKKYQRYKKVLELIQELTISKNDGFSFVTDTNQFLLMKKPLYNKNKITVETYNYALAKELLADITKRDEFKSPIFKKVGPFLITTTKSFFNTDNNPNFLCVNLSSFNEKAIQQVLESYKERLEKHGNNDIGILERLHYTMLSTLTNFNDDISIFKAAVAGELP
ncbi:MAG: Unknown protein [uncultured Sulfurovum sp.]|uniref:Lipoprotein n=1 Tax=uncultured Sulfurovum sp. TaxID=269237 RepID=A0A6S6TUM1_9BACT|nr:MAG: Unknown protein [uncultured Sulfurovum sp.]